MGICLSEPIHPIENSARTLKWTGSDLVLRWALWQPGDNNNYHLFAHDDMDNPFHGPPRAISRSAKKKAHSIHPEGAMWATCNKYDGYPPPTQGKKTAGRCIELLVNTKRATTGNSRRTPLFPKQQHNHQTPPLSLSPLQKNSIKLWINIIEKESKQKLSPLQRFSVQNFWVSTQLVSKSAFF